MDIYLWILIVEVDCQKNEVRKLIAGNLFLKLIC